MECSPLPVYSAAIPSPVALKVCPEESVTKLKEHPGPDRFDRQSYHWSEVRSERLSRQRWDTKKVTDQSAGSFDTAPPLD